MRLELRCNVKSVDSMLHYNYRKDIQTMIYDIIGSYDFEFGKSVHDSKEISNFTYSEIICKTNILKRKDGIFGINFFTIEFSSNNEKIINAIKSIKNNRNIYRFSENFVFILEDVIEIQDDFDGLYDESTIFASSVICTKKSIGKSGKETIISYEPNEEGFKNSIFNNLLKKYKLMGGLLSFNINDMDINFEVNSSSVEKYKNKNGGLKYYNISFTLKCPKELKVIAYSNGIGEKNNLGFGYIKIKK